VKHASITSFTTAKTLACVLTLMAGWKIPEVRAADTPGQSFATPSEAVIMLESAAAAADFTKLRAIFGSKLDDISNPDRVQSTNEIKTFAAALRETNRLVSLSGKRMAVEYGPDRSSFPVPLVQSAGRWVFDTEAGAEELVNRRIGRNELAVLSAMRTYVEAQREYATADRDGDEVLEHAQRFRSTDGEKDGLFWPEDLDGSVSPLGPLVADAQAEGYNKGAGTTPEPFNGYLFRILTRQGKHAPGGAYDYIINGNMIGGFALVAWPAEYDETGVMSFIVNHQGRIYQKDLGPKTGKIASSMKVYDVDSSWAPSRD
jgi:hypothetical protein